MRPATLRELRTELTVRTARLSGYETKRDEAGEAADADQANHYQYLVERVSQPEVQTILDAIEYLRPTYVRLSLKPRECFAKTVRFLHRDGDPNHMTMDTMSYPGHTITRTSHRGEGGQSGRVHYLCECGWSHTFEPQEVVNHIAAYNHLLLAYRAHMACLECGDETTHPCSECPVAGEGTQAENVAQGAHTEPPSPFTEEGQTRELTREHIELHLAICKRFEEAQNQSQLDTRGISYRNPYGDRMSRMMDLEAVHQELDMDWQRLLDAKDGDFMHDVCGIHGHMDRSTATLGDCFLPRFAR